MMRTISILLLLAIAAALAAAGSKPPATDTAAPPVPPPGQAAPGAAGAKLPAIAVMTLEHASGKPDDEWMGIGFAETITGKLARLRNIRVVERRQIERVMREIALSQTGAVDAAVAVRAGKLLAANYLLVGSVQKLEARRPMLKVNARVIKTESGEVLETVGDQGPYDDIFELQDRLAIKVAEALSLPVSLAEKQDIRRSETSSRGAYEFFYMAKAAPGMDHKEELYRKAVGLDPNYVNALANLASVLMVKNLSCPEPDFSEAKQLALKALALDSLIAESHWILGSIYRREGRKQDAIRELEKHLKLDPETQYKGLIESQLEKLRK